MKRTARTVRAVLWQRAGESTPEPLMHALEKQGISFVRATNQYDAFSRLLSWKEHGERVLLLVEPEGLAGSLEVRRSLLRYDPQAGCWAYRAAGSPRLMPLPPPGREIPADPEIVVKPGRGVRSKPELRLAGQSEQAGQTHADPDDPGEMPAKRSSAPTADASEPQSSHSILTAEELAMLLTDKKKGQPR